MKSKNQIKFEYDAETDAAYLTLARGRVKDSEEVKPGLVLDYDAADNIVGVEILRFEQRFAKPSRGKRLAS